MALPEEVGPEGVGFICMGAPRINGGRVHTGILAWYPRKKKIKVVLRDRNGAFRVDAAGNLLTMMVAYSSFDPSWKPGHGPLGRDCEFCEPWREL